MKGYEKEMKVTEGKERNRVTKLIKLRGATRKYHAEEQMKKVAREKDRLEYVRRCEDLETERKHKLRMEKQQQEIERMGGCS